MCGEINEHLQFSGGEWNGCWFQFLCSFPMDFQLPEEEIALFVSEREKFILTSLKSTHLESAAFKIFLSLNDILCVIDDGFVVSHIQRYKGKVQ